MKLMLGRVGCALGALALFVVARPAAAATPVCVQVEVKHWQRTQPPPTAVALPKTEQKPKAPEADTSKDVKAGPPLSPAGAKEPNDAAKPESPAANSAMISFG